MENFCIILLQDCIFNLNGGKYVHKTMKTPPHQSKFFLLLLSIPLPLNLGASNHMVSYITPNFWVEGNFTTPPPKKKRNKKVVLI